MTNLFLVLHIVGGTLGLLSGLFVLCAQKGTLWHMRAGRIYAVSMIVAACSALVLSVVHPNAFLFIVGIFTLYLVVSGWRYIRWPQRMHAARTDWLIMILMLLFSGGFFSRGAALLFGGETFGLVLVVFGMISLLMCAQDFRNFTGRSPVANFWLTTHLQRMTGGYIASLTAFLVVNNTFLPALMAWMLPTVLLTPLIFFWTKKYRAKSGAR